jgi:hypothetical protein
MDNDPIDLNDVSFTAPSVAIGRRTEHENDEPESFQQCTEDVAKGAFFQGATGTTILYLLFALITLGIGLVTGVCTIAEHNWCTGFVAVLTLFVFIMLCYVTRCPKCSLLFATCETTNEVVDRKVKLRYEAKSRTTIKQGWGQQIIETSEQARPIAHITETIRTWHTCRRCGHRWYFDRTVNRK